MPDEAWGLIRAIPLPTGVPPNFLEDRIKKGGVRAVIPYISRSLFDRRRGVAERTTALLSLLLQALPSSELPALDQEMRAYSVWRSASWDRLEPGDLRHLKQGPANWASLAVLSMHGSGYVREAALQRLAELRGGTELPYLFIRLNDWVAEIREFAESAVSERLTLKDAAGLVHLLPLVGRISHWSRAARNLESRIRAVLSSADSRLALLAGARAKDLAVRRQAVSLLIEAGGESMAAVLQTALHDKDVVVRTRAAAAAREALDGEQLRAALEQMGRNRAARVRQEALIGWVRRFPEESQDRLIDALLDRLAAARGLAQYELRTRGFDVVEFYRRRISEASSPEPEAIAGLGEVGTAEESRLVIPYLSSVDGRTRGAALHAVDRIGGAERARLLVAALRDPAPSVSKVARRAIVANPTGVDFAAVLAGFLQDDRRYVRRNSFRVLITASKWSWLRYALIASSDHDSEIRAEGLRQLDIWVLKWNRSFVEPTAPDSEGINQAIDALDEELRANVLDRIGFFLGPLKPLPKRSVEAP